MKKEFDRLKAWLEINYPLGIEDLNPPARDEEIKELENTLGVVLPKDFVEILKIHNGQKGNSAWLFDSQEFLSTSRIVDEWKAWNKLSQKDTFPKIAIRADKGIKALWWNIKWIPFSSDGSGDNYCLDLDPLNSGKSGQVITLWHDYEERELVSRDFKTWFKNYIDALYTGDFFYSQEYNSIVNKNEI